MTRASARAASARAAGAVTPRVLATSLSLLATAAAAPAAAPAAAAADEEVVLVNSAAPAGAEAPAERQARNIMAHQYIAKCPKNGQLSAGLVVNRSDFQVLETAGEGDCAALAYARVVYG
jgi:hypothetical protein